MTSYRFIRQLKSELKKILKIINLGLVGMPDITFLVAAATNGNEPAVAIALPKLDMGNSITSQDR